MKKVTKQRIGVLFVASIFFMSSIAYVITTAIQPEEKPEELEKFVIEGKLDPEIENEYLGRGFTSMKFYYSDSDLISYVEQLPDYLRTSRNQIQLIVQKIPNNETFVEIVGPYGEEELRNVTQDSIFKALCSILLATPVECGYEGLNITTTANITGNTTNSTS
jgi:hypothetical protein